MRSWVEKLAKVIKKEGAYTYINEITIRNYRIKLEKFREDIGLYVHHYKVIDNDAYYDKNVYLKLYQDEYDLLCKIFKDVEESEQDALIEIFNSFE